MKTADRIIVALDFAARDEVVDLLDRLPELTFVKVGMELFYSEGPSLVSLLKDRGLRVFVDLKVHDIPNTAHKAIKALSRLGCDMLNVHCAGGLEMMQRAREAAGEDTKLIGVTMLTSIDQAIMNSQLGIRGTIADCVLNYAAMAKAAGLHGVVCSPHEVQALRSHLGKDFLAVTPGVRPAGSAAGDQRRSMTPAEAITAGSDYLVIGRPITANPDPGAAFAEILREIEVVM